MLTNPTNYTESNNEIIFKTRYFCQPPYKKIN